MRKIPLALTLLGFLYVAGTFERCLAEEKKDSKDITMTGTFVWEKKKGQNHDIKAVFTPNGDKKWNVVYTFEWAMGKNKGGEQSWKGTAEGDLLNGDIKGEGLHPNGQRKFTFTGTAKDGKIDATHMEITGGKNEATGSITLKKE
jgi:hypothetical protein